MEPEKNNRSKIIIFVLLFVFITSMAAGLFLFFKQKENANTVATINGEKITKDDVAKLSPILKKEFEHDGDAESVKNLDCKTVDELIENKIIETEAAKRNLTPDTQATDKEYNDLVQKYGGEEQLKQTISGLYGMDLNFLKERIRRDNLKEQIKDQVLKEYTLSFVMVRHDRVKADQTPDTAASAQALQKITQIKAQLDSGITMEKIHDELIADPAWQYPLAAESQMVEVNAEVVKKMWTGNIEWNAVSKLTKVGQMTEILKSEDGYYVIYRADKIRTGTLATWQDFLNDYKSKNKVTVCSQKTSFLEKVLGVFSGKAYAACDAWTVSSRHLGEIITYAHNSITKKPVNVKITVKVHSYRGWCPYTAYDGPYSGYTGTDGLYVTPQEKLACTYDYTDTVNIPTGYNVDMDNVWLLDYLHPKAVQVRPVLSGLTAYIITKPYNELDYAKVWWNFNPVYKLTVVSNPSGGATFTGVKTAYNTNEIATATATINTTKYEPVVESWSGAGCTGSGNKVTVKMDGNKTCTANLKLKVVTPPPPTITLTVDSIPADAATFSGVKSSYVLNETATVTATVTDTSKYESTVASWTGSGCVGSGNTVTVKMDSSKACTANFNQKINPPPPVVTPPVVTPPPTQDTPLVAASCKNYDGSVPALRSCFLAISRPSFGVMGGVGLGFLIYNTILFIMARGEPEKMAKARKGLLISGIAVIGIALSWAIITLFVSILN